MRNKKLFVTIAVMLLVVFTLSLALVACKKKPEETPPEDTPSGAPVENPPWVDPGPGDDEEEPGPVIPNYATSFRGAVGYMVESMPSEYLSLNFTGMATVRGKKYQMSLKGNLSAGDIQVAAVFRPEGSNNVAFAIYIVNSKLFFELEDGTILNVAEIDANYLASIIDKVPDKLSGVIEELLGQYQSFIPLALDILLGGLSPASKIKYEAENGVEEFELYLDVQGLINSINSIVGKGGLLGLFIQDLDLSFIAELLDMIPPIDGQIKATVDNKRLSKFSLEFYDNDPESETYRQTLVGVDSAITFSSTPLALEIPEGLENYESLTLGNLNFDVSFDIDTHGESFDLGALIDDILPLFEKKKGENNNEVETEALTAPLFGKGVLVLRGDADYRLDIQASLDPNIDGSNADDNNYINIVLWAGSNQLVRANYLDGKIYVKALADGINGFAEGGINVAIPLDLKDYISQLVDLVTNKIDQLLGTQYKPDASGAILSASIDENGEAVLSPSLQNVIMGVMKLVGFENSVVTSGDKVTVVIDKTFFEAINKLVKPKNPISLPFFGELALGLHKGGIEYLEITAMDILTLRADGFHLGKAQISRQDVLDSIGDIDQYGEDVKGIMMNFALSLISDLELSIDLDLSTVNTTVNMTPIINSIMAVAKNSTYLKFPINLDLTNYDGTFTLRVATNYVNETGDGRMLLELKAPSGDPLITAYNENDRTYVDLTGLGFMKFCLTGVNLFQTVRGLLGADMAAEDFVEEVAPAIAMSSFTSGVEIDSDYVGVAVNSYLVTMILRMLAMDLGMDVDLQAHLGFDGSIEATLGLGSVAALGINMSLGKESETEHRIVDILNDLTIAEYGVYDTFDAEALVDSILVAERLNLAIDLYNHNVDVIGNEDYHENKSRIVIRNSAATDKDHPEVFSNGLAAPYKSIVLAIYAGWTNSSSAALLYGYIDLDGDKVQIKGTRNLLRVSIVGQEVTGELVDVPIPNLGLKKKLVDALSGLFGESGDDFGGAIEVPDGALPAQKPSVEHKCKHACPFCGECLDATCTDPVCKTKATCNGVHCEHACSVCGRCLDKTSTKDVCKNKCDGLPECTIEQIIPGITISLSGNMDIDVDANINGEYISAVLKDLLTGVFTDMDISSITGSDKHKHQNVTYSNTVANTFYNSLWDNVIAPLISAQVPVVGGAISGLAGLVAKDTVHTTVQRFLPISDVKNLKVNLSITDGRVANITAIGSNPNNNLGFGLYVFNKKADNVVSWENQATYIYYNPTLGGKALIDMFEKKARKHEGDNWEVDSWANISWTLKDTNVSHETFCDNLSQYETGKEYTFVGTAWGENLEVTVFLHDSKVKSVKDMQVKAMREIPSYVTAVFADGSERIIPDVEIVCNRVNGEKNASVTINDENYEFTIVFEEEDITLDTLVLNAYDYLDVINSLKDSGVIRVKVNDTFYRNLPATYDFKMFTDEYIEDENGEQVKNPNYKTRQDLQNPAKYQINVHVGKGTDYERDMVLEVEFTPFDIYYIERNGLNYIETDFIEYAREESFPDEITVVGYNGKDYLEYTAKAKWNTDGVVVDLKGGQYFASVVLNEGDYNQWKLEGVEVNVLPSDIVGLSNSNKTVTFDWKYAFYGNVPEERCYPTLLNFKTSGGIIKRDVPVTIDMDKFFEDEAAVEKAMAEGMTIECPVSIDIKKKDGKSLYATTIQVYVPSIKMSLAEKDQVIEINYQDYVEQGKSAFFKDKMEIFLGEDKVTANVTWFTGNVVFTEDGTYTAIVYLDENGKHEQQCEVTVKITGAPTLEEV